MYLALNKCKNDCKNYSGTDFCPLKPEIARSSNGFRLNSLIFSRYSVSCHFVTLFSNSVNFLSFLAPLEVQYSCIHGLSFHTYLSS